MEAYFDNSATTKVSEAVKDIVVKVMVEDYGNPSSMHMVGVNAEKYLKAAQENIAKILKVDPKEIYFTSGGTEDVYKRQKLTSHSLQQMNRDHSI